MSEEQRAELMARAVEEPAVHTPGVTTLYHYSEDGGLRRFAPHVPPTNPGHPPQVWAIDEAHSPLYWFPRDCPRISVWAYDAEQQAILTDVFETEASRVCAAEISWLDRVRSGHIYRYSFDAAGFRPWEEADGQYIADDVRYPTSVDRYDDLLALHIAAGVELRFTPRLGVLMDRMLASRLPFSFVRIRDASR
ncbi:MAG: hypothetical protein QNJ12_20385 [Ilumatobacter sp.]|uniref:DUF6886 family protein n=1 Tax=Ilumatobacter sp. TaxID=1967498 RepID=UPI00261ED77F|nr:DUF6886 family protein [Ilumatobacter sp.]MDJ0771158.1 hypothetical protein [Ilumatobacter sp.]